MDLYTSSFGKLQKQKEGNIAQMTRERQKLTDQRNNAIRRGMGKALSNKNLYETVLKGGGQELLNKAEKTSQHFTDFEKGQLNTNNQFITAQTAWNNGAPQDLTGAVGGIISENLDAAGDYIKRGISTIQTNHEAYQKIKSMAQDGVDSLTDSATTAVGFIGDFLTLLPAGLGNTNQPQTPQLPDKSVEDRRGPKEEE